MAYLNILTQSPIFLEAPVNQTVSIGQEVTLRCSAKGYPTPTISWMYNDLNVSEVANEFRVTDKGDLVVKRVSSSYADRKFECIAENDHGNSVAPAFLNVVSTTTIQLGPVDSIAQVKWLWIVLGLSQLLFPIAADKWIFIFSNCSLVEVDFN